MNEALLFKDQDDEIPSRINEFESCTETNRELSSQRAKTREPSMRKLVSIKNSKNQSQSVTQNLNNQISEIKYKRRSPRLHKFQSIGSYIDQTYQISNSKKEYISEVPENQDVRITRSMRTGRNSENQSFGREKKTEDSKMVREISNQIFKIQATSRKNESYSVEKLQKKQTKKTEILWTREELKIRKTKKVARNDRPKAKNLPFKTKNPVDYLELILDHEFFETVVFLTNNAKAVIMDDQEYLSDEENGNKKSHEVLWRDITVIELRTFLGLFFWMGLIRYPAITDHWATNPIFKNDVFSSKMSRDRFKQILARLTFSDKQSEKKDIPFNKLSVLISKVLENSKRYYQPGKNLSIDESMIAFSGRHQAKVYMPTKPIRYGFKAYVLSEASTGFLLEWRMHDRSKSLTVAQIIDNLLESYPNCNVYMDSFYSTIESFRTLKERNILACGTISKQRLTLTALNEDIDGMAEETALCYSNGDLKLFIWKTRKKKIFYLLSTKHSNYMQSSRRYDIKSKQFIEVYKPEAIEDYNLNMRGVDLFDQYLRYYSFIHGSKKWYKKISYYFLETAIINSFIIYNQVSKTLSLKDYKVSIIRSLLEIGSDDVSLISSFDDIKLCALGALGAGKQLDCQICSDRSSINYIQKSRKRTGYFCKTCNVPVCVLDCYDIHLNTIKK